ncbi:MAG: lipid IV(A) 3-deoxy-D-manno-octulosonic acid transferase [Congregibacter sp.]
MRLLYSLLFTLLVPILMLRMLWRSRLAPAYRRRLWERLGYVTLPVDSRPTLWIHAVSLGETIAAKPLIERLLLQRPDYRLLITTTTPTGSEQVQQLFGDRVVHVYAPWDAPFAVKRFLRQARPDVLVLMETELWPNMLHYSAVGGCRIMLANARLSARSAAGYARFPATVRRMLNQLHWVAAQSAADADRFLQLGTDPGRIAVSGSIKFDSELDEATREEALSLRSDWQLDFRPSFIMASTHRGEDEVALAAFVVLRERFPDLLLVLVPRHPERFEQVYALIYAAGWSVERRSSDLPVSSQTDVLLVDTLGELSLFYGLVDVAVIGGSFIAHGGHNALEAAVWSKPMLCGESMFNFAQLTQHLLDAGALVQLQNSPDVALQLAAQLSQLLENPGERERRGRAAMRVIEANRGALDALFTALDPLLADR